jgi:hypothetical protein
MFQGNISPPFSRWKITASKKPARIWQQGVCFLLGLFFDPENGGGMFLRNVGFSPDYTELQPRRYYSL